MKDNNGGKSASLDVKTSFYIKVPACIGKLIWRTAITVLTNRSKVLKNNKMVMCGQVMDNARLQAGSNAGIDGAVKEIVGDFFKPSTRKKATGYTIVAGGTINLVDLKTGKPFVNTGNTILSILIKGGSAALTIIINPGSGVNIPKGWTNITVTNLSATIDGSFDVFLK